MLRHARLIILVAGLSSAAVYAEPQKAALDPNKIICKRQALTGSLVDSKRECHTRAEWTQLVDQNRDEARRQLQSVAAQGGSGH